MKKLLTLISFTMMLVACNNSTGNKTENEEIKEKSDRIHPSKYDEQTENDGIILGEDKPLRKLRLNVS